jgi:hypothetical protein
MKRKLCPTCNFQKDIDFYEEGYTNNNREYILTFMNRTYIKIKLESGKYSWKGIGWYCHECGHVEVVKKVIDNNLSKINSGKY